MSRRPDFISTTTTSSSQSLAPHVPLAFHSQTSPSSPTETHRSYSAGNSTTTSHRSAMDEDDATPSPPPSYHRPPPSSAPAREDCWSEDATHTLIEAWGERYLELNRGNLRQKHWQEVADAVNARHGHVKKARRTDMQCKNRIDTLKKKYKIEKSKLLESKGNYTSPWSFFPALDSLIGSSFSKTSRSAMPYRKPLPSPPTWTPTPKQPPPLPLPPPLPQLSVPVGLRSKRPAPPTDSSYFRRNFSAMAAAAAAVEAAAEEEEGDSHKSSSSFEDQRRSRDRQREQDPDGEVDAYRHLAEAIGRFGEIYERVEEAKQRQMLELEKQRMQFTKDLELQRMKLFMESQVHLEKLKRSKRSSGQVFNRCNGENSASVSQ